MTRAKRNRKCKRPWAEVFHVAIAPRLGLAGLQAVQAALDNDDAALIQGETVLPDLMSVSRDVPCRARRLSERFDREYLAVGKCWGITRALQTALDTAESEFKRGEE
jgi:hypothetical protein